MSKRKKCIPSKQTQNHLIAANNEWTFYPVYSMIALRKTAGTIKAINVKHKNKKPINGLFWMLWIGLPIIMTKVIDAPTNTKNSSQESMCDQKIERLTIMIALGMQLMIGLLVKLMVTSLF